MIIGIFVPGMFGRMGTLIIDAALGDDRHAFLGGTSRPGSPQVGKSVTAYFPNARYDFPIHDDLEKTISASTLDCDAKVVIDYTSPETCVQHLKIAMRHQLPLVIGTTGLTDEQHQEIEKASAHIPILVAANTSLGANLLGALTRIATKALPDADMEITEIHHRHKKDAPSGTALMLGQIAATARGTELSRIQKTARSGNCPREKDEIGIFGVRGGTVPGEHTVYFFLDGERIEFTHRVQDRRIFALGALAAARTLAQKGPGLYSMADVLGLES